MATELRWALIIISALVIGGLLIHGLWSVRRKERSESASKSDPAIASETNSTTSTVRDDEPEIGEINLTAVDEEPVAVHESDADDKVEPEKNESESEPVAEPSDFIILHISMPEGLTMAGSKLLPCVLSLGFKYSEEGFFNRHVEPSGNGPVMFRLVNSFNPGTFDIDNMEQFSTAGVSLFMTLPCEGDSLAAFNMLHSAAKKLAEEFGAEVLDSNREPLSVAMVRTYVEKVREYAA
ncbi:cell division protein ZipA C-terminal FtsZ-binding domain-containing protein [Pseudoalteromonas xiamenensis]|uniref:cell division protein ZipA C-terminal FtsZ-binding domain-containing protein n=1 Tax=Pseudoalteromonas xiamenensis TaxID=882626 RepID=UPI0027E45565|nr:cell division protein ZipA C-terminal FtsZ-binding domain-containing protein [Pseudoalteromonas xiamenensis]WMN59467.1 cell division protein ZipA C-terminal FtsZ-binding domain-containing protein [Pseudoalteromonas xiamenensis]